VTQQFPESVTIVEVGPRDGLQNEKTILPTDQKVALVDDLSSCGFQKIEVGSFVHPAHVPQMADSDELFRRIRRRPGTRYSGLVPNVRGARRALEAGVEEINVVVAASETFNRENVGMTVEASLAAFGEIASLVSEQGSDVWLSIATAFGCPFEGPVKAGEVVRLAETAAVAGAAGVSLADTTGMANPRQVIDTIRAVRGAVGDRLSVLLHFHNTRGMALANALAALEAGETMFDSAIGGLGGCPFAPGATGNACTEDLVHMMEEMGVRTGIDLDRLIRIAREIEAALGHPLPGQVMKAGPRSRCFTPSQPQ
jgi:hydroxymethylglutaryl-CoA lyase